jgi:hypothetical protein
MRIGRNDPCPCGSGKKFKKCCLGKPSEGLRIAAKPGDSFLVDDVVDFDDADGPIQVYDPLVEPDPVEWLATGEQDEWTSSNTTIGLRDPMRNAATRTRLYTPSSRIRSRPAMNCRFGAPSRG